MNANYRHQRHNEHWGGHDNCRMMSVSLVPSADWNKTAGCSEEGGNADYSKDFLHIQFGSFSGVMLGEKRELRYGV